MEAHPTIVKPKKAAPTVSKCETEAQKVHPFVSFGEIAGTPSSCGIQGIEKGANETVPVTKRNPLSEHVADPLKRVLSDLRGSGLSDRQVRQKLKAMYGNFYEGTYNHWRNKVSRNHARGIPMDGSFESFPDFLAHMGFKPGAYYEIHRIDNSIPYFLGNCRWLDPRTNKHLRGDAEMVGAYVAITKVSKATAYRHLKKDRTAFYRKVGKESGPQKGADPTKEREFSEAHFLFRRFFEELQTIDSTTIIPKKPSRKQLGQLLHIVQAFDYSEVVLAIPAIVHHWANIAQRARLNYAIYLGDKSSCDKLLQHPQIIFQLAEEIVREENLRAHHKFLKSQAITTPKPQAVATPSKLNPANEFSDEEIKAGVALFNKMMEEVCGVK